MTTLDLNDVILDDEPAMARWHRRLSVILTRHGYVYLHHRISNFVESCNEPLRSFLTSSVNNWTLTFQTPFASSLDNVTLTLLSNFGFNMPSFRQQILYCSPLIGFVRSCPNSNKDKDRVISLLACEGVRFIASIRCYD
jgi:hypothetical protein